MLLPLLLLLAVVSATPLVWKNCGDDELFNVTKVDLSPYPVEAGKQAIITSTGTQSETVTNGTWYAYISKYGFKVQQMKGDVCGLSPTCPCPCSDKVVTTVLKIPVTPSAFTTRYSGKFTSNDQYGKSLSCVTFEFDLVKN